MVVYTRCTKGDGGTVPNTPLQSSTILGDIMNEKALEIMRQDVEENRTAYKKMAEAESVGRGD